MKAEMKREPKERPILFSGEMVNAILEGRKTQTRRVNKHMTVERYPSLATPAEWNAGKMHPDMPDWETWGPKRGSVLFRDAYGGVVSWECPYGKPGDRLWVRETFSPRYFDDGKPAYKADWTPGAAEYVTEPKWKPSIHIPRSLARITLEITNVRVERLQDISEEDSLAEGMKLATQAHGMHPPARDQFQILWDKINGKQHPWASNPWLWVVEFERIAT